jgi:hypothetical protein
MILILTEPYDPHADHVCRMLKERGAEWIRFNSADFPAQACLSVGFSSNGKMGSSMRLGDTVIDLAQVQSIWTRRPKLPVPHDHLQDASTRRLVADECQMFVRDLWNAIPGRWLPGRQAAIQRAELKASQLRVAGALGLELPATLITNNPDEFLAFYNEHNGNIVSKVTGFGFSRLADRDFSRYTEAVSKRHVGYAASLQYCPVIFQAYVAKQFELRVTVVGKRVFAAEIHSQLTNHTRYDWRRYDLSRTPHLRHELPPEIQDKCVRLVEQLELSYGAIDLVLTPEGRYVFLEINPNGQYLWIEEQTGLPISAAICDLLMTDSRGETA